MSHISSPDATIILNRDSNKFVTFSKTFTHPRSYQRKAYEKAAIESLVQNSSIRTPAFEKFIKDKYPEFLVSVQGKRLVDDIMNFEPVIYGKQTAQNYLKLRDAHLPESERIHPTKPVKSEPMGAMVSPQDNVNVELELAMIKLAKTEVNKTQSELAKIASEKEEGSADTVPENIQVEEATAIKDLDPKQETPRTVLEELEESKKYYNIIKGKTEKVVGDQGNQTVVSNEAETFVVDVTDTTPVNAEVSLEDQGTVVLSTEEAAAIQPSGGLSETDIQQLEPDPQEVVSEDPVIQDDTERQEGTTIDEKVATVVPEVPSSHAPKYHKQSVLFYFDSISNPDWDHELEKNIYGTELSADYMTDSMDAVIEKYGPDIGVFSRESESKDEYHIIQQLLFSRMRNMQRGTRSKQALVPISSLTDFASKLAPEQFPVQKPTVTPEIPSVIDPNEGGSGQVQTPQVAAPVRTGKDKTISTVKVAQNDAIEEVVDAYRSAEFDRWGKPRINQGIVDQTKVHHFNILGPSSKIDPARQYVPGVLESKLKVSGRNCKTIKI